MGSYRGVVMANYSDLVKTSEQTGTGKQGTVTNNSDLPLTGNTAGDLQLVTSTNRLVVLSLIHISEPTRPY